MIRAAVAALALYATVAAPASARADDVDRLYKCAPIRDKAQVSISIAPDTRLDALVTWYMSFTCSTVVYSADVACRTPGANVVVPEPITVREARALFFDALEVMGLRAKVKGKKVVITEAKGKAKVDHPGCAGASTALVSHDPSPAVDPVDAPAEDAIDLDVIKQIDDTHVEIPKALVDQVLANPMAISKGARVGPSVRNGTPNGFKLYAIRPSSIYARLGFKNGDTITSINGHDLTAEDKVLEVYTKLRDATRLEIAVVRKAKPLTIEITIK